MKKIESGWPLRTIGVLHNPIVAWAILGLSLLFTVIAYFVAENFVRDRASDRFEFRSQEIEKAIQDRLALYEQVLRGGVGLVNASGFDVTRQEFADYVDTLNIDEHWPGIQGIGFSVPIAADEKAAHIAAIRAEGFPEYELSPPGERDFYTAIIYLEPFDWRNQRAFGYDMWSNDMRRDAMRHARDGGVAATSGRITLVQETEDDIQAGFLIYLPVYSSDDVPTSVAERRERFVGWVYAPFRIHDLMMGILGHGDSDIEFQIYDGEAIAPQSLLYQSNPNSEMGDQDVQVDFTRSQVINQRGRPWTLYFRTPESFTRYDAEKKQPLYVALAGGTVDVLLFYLIYMLYIANKRAQALTDERHAIIEHAPSAFIMADQDGVISLANRLADTLFGYEPGELVGRSIEDLIPKPTQSQHPHLRESFFRAPSARLMGGGRDLNGRRKDGSDVPVEIGLNPIDMGGSQYVLASVVDITERKRNQEQLEIVNERLQEKNLEMEQFIYTVSHDLKSPLVTIGGFSESLIKSLGEDLTEKQQHQLRRIRANVDHMEDLLSDLLKLSRVIRQDIEKDQVDTAQLTARVISTLEAPILSSGAKVNVGSALLPVFANERLVYQCLQNLLSNSIQYRYPNRPLEINIATTARADCVELSVSDNGIGIDPTYHERIFGIFERLGIGEGSGVGLAIVKTIMDKHGGRVELQSTEGVGTRFSLFFPATSTNTE